ncbi:MAG: hypothetical protein BRC30_02055 [Nanohaloarchaea archaeon SW_7_46_7]|nr:MAG: hypothetical protein BRC30_02055 [Nanohaloarchaea archaeon SW_7_46_7]
MSSGNSDWVDEIIEAERGLEPDELTDSGRDKFLNRYGDLESLWREFSPEYSGSHEDSSFRIPVGKDDALNCLGRALMVGMYDELSEGESESHISIYFDDKWSEDGTSTMKRPHVTATVDGTEYGRPGKKKDTDLPVSSLKDLYKVGLAVQVFNEGTEIDDIGYEQIHEWGGEIENTYSKDSNNHEFDESYSGESENLDSEYLRRQGLLMQQDAEEARMEDSIGGDDVYIA